MEDFGSICPLLAIILFIVILRKLDNRFGKVEKELDEIKKRMDTYLKTQQKVTVKEEKVQEHSSMEAVENVPIPPGVQEELLAVEEPLREEILIEESVEEEREVVQEDVKRKIVEEVLPIAPKRKNVNYEKFIGENLFGKIGILIFVIGVGFFVKYAIDKDWINEIFRTILGFLTGAALLAVAARLQKKYRTFSSLLAGGAFAVFYLTVAIAFHYYHLFSQTLAFIILVGVTVFMSVLSTIYDRRELAIISLVGGFLAPFIVSSGEGSYMVLFTYLSILNLGMFWLSVYKKWGELPVVSFVFTYLVMGIYLLTGYDYNSTVVSGHLFLFATLFYFIFLLPILSILQVETKKMSKVLVFAVITNNFVYLLLGILLLQHMELPFKSEGLLSLFIAIVNLVLVIWLWKSKKDSRYLFYTMLGLVLTFVSITVPLQLDGNLITLCWASEMVLLLWLYAKSKIRVYERGTFILVCLTLISFLVDVFKAPIDDPIGIIFLNSTFATSIFVGLAMGTFALLMEQYRDFFSTARLLNYTPWNAMMFLLSVAILYYTFMEEFYLFFDGTTRSGAMLLFTSVAIGFLCYAFRKRFPMKRNMFLYISAIGINVFVYILNIWCEQWQNMTLCPSLLRWCTVLFVIADLSYVARHYYATVAELKVGFTIYLNILATLLWVTIVRFFLWQIEIEEFSAGFSLSLSIAGFVQMGLGMRFHQKVLRMISLATFGIVLFKLVFIDLWAMPTIGKIIVFIILGLILLVLSFLYQKLKDVLFKNDENVP
ncbi:Predicted membrane protein [Bacteroides faecichinchillae]|uniref:Predicted membrane protein n=1 Tax=Bacteroides faecichinchillae TaxID=871325 RepID=A0A1M5FKC7_9BACE|nr:DUF2339 domain-containing protein [Bacteroides faecichinchillae]THG60064.1 DUF2339 domain-containing protein [Bacteroides faecichinchillae]SHF91958.1 Predicted membrane protein [Bacteroides faecichinchillae]